LNSVNFKDLKQKEYLTESEGMAYTTLSRKTFRRWAMEIGAVRKLEDTPRGRVLYVRETIDKAILEGRQ